MMQENIQAADLKKLPLLACGNYHYWLDGKSQAVTEPWRLYQGENSFILSGQRIVNKNTCLEVISEFSSKRRCTGLSLIWNDANGTQHWHYQHQTQPQRLNWRKQNQAWQKTAMPPGARLFPLLRAAAAPLVRELSQQPHLVVVPSLHDPNKAEEFLAPRSSLRHCEAQADPGHYRYFGGEYGAAGSDYWLNAKGFLSAYEWKTPQGVWRIELCEDDYAAGFKRF